MYPDFYVAFNNGIPVEVIVSGKENLKKYIEEHPDETSFRYRTFISCVGLEGTVYEEGYTLTFEDLVITVKGLERMGE